MKFLERLNSEQKSAVTAPKGIIRVLAGAGTGKTTCLTAKIAYEVHKGMDPRKILALTFTKKAGAELKSRLNELIGDKTIGLFAGTFHSFAHGHLSKILTYSIIHDDDVYDIIKGIDEEYDTGFSVEDIIQLISYHRNLQKPYADENLAKIEQEYKAFKLQNNLKDFDDLLTDFLALLKENYFKFNYELVLTDESQDNSVVQNQIIKQIIKNNRNLFVVGDAAQSIYGFRAASLESFYGWKEEGCKDYPLTFNYRSTNEVLKVANKILMGLKTEDNLKLILRNPIAHANPPKAKVVKTGNVEDEIIYVINKIKELRASGHSYESMAILYRSHYYSQQLQIKMAEAGIPLTVWSGQNVLGARHIKDVMAFLRAYVNKNDVLAWTRVLSLMPRVGKKIASQLATSIQSHGIQAVNHPSIGPVKSVFQHTNQSSFFQALKNFYIPYIKNEYPEDHRDVATAKFLSYVEAQPDLRKIVADLMFNETDKEEAKGVIMSTVHSAKGLEWNNVFVIGCYDGVFPNLKNEDLQEEIRLFYVAVTRAKTNLFCMFPEVSSRKQQTKSLFYNLIVNKD
jgi:DNA helicase-2/ATP-dependent DNA helicase PcrA